MSSLFRFSALAAGWLAGVSSLEAGLLAYFPFDGDFSDASGQANHLTAEPGTDPSITTNPALVAVGDGALDLDGDDWLNLTSPLAFGPGDPWSVAFWVKRAPNAAAQDGMIVGEVGSSSNFIWTPDNPSVVQGLRFRNGSGASSDFGGFPDDHAYHHWAVIAPGDGSVTVYRDNISLGSLTPSGGTTFTASDVGHAFSQTGQIHFGQIDELYLYDEALAPARIAELSGTSTGPDETPPALSSSDIVDGRDGGEVTSGMTVVFTVTFSEDMDASSVGVDDFGTLGDAPVTFGAVREISPGTFTIEVRPTGTGTLQLAVLQDAELLDSVGNPLNTTQAIADNEILTVVDPPEPVPIRRIRVVLLGGQSNAAGRGNPNELPTFPVNLQLPQDDVLFYEGSSLTALRPGSQFGPEITLGRTMAATLRLERGTRVAILKYGVGGTSLAVDWKPGGDATTAGDGPRYVTFQQTVSNGLAALASAYPGASIELAGLLWVQGERDAKGGFENDYEDNLVAFIEDVRITYGAELPFVISRLAIEQTNIPLPQLDILRAAQTVVANDDPLSPLLDTDGFGMQSDSLHFDSIGLQRIGASAARTLLAFHPIPPIRTELEGRNLTLILDAPLSGFRYTLQTSGTLASDDWTDRESVITDGTPLTLTGPSLDESSARFIRLKRTSAP